MFQIDYDGLDPGQNLVGMLHPLLAVSSRLEIGVQQTSHGDQQYESDGEQRRPPEDRSVEHSEGEFADGGAGAARSAHRQSDDHPGDQENDQGSGIAAISDGQRIARIDEEERRQRHAQKGSQQPRPSAAEMGCGQNSQRQRQQLIALSKYGVKPEP